MPVTCTVYDRGSVADGWGFCNDNAAPAVPLTERSSMPKPVTVSLNWTVKTIGLSLVGLAAVIVANSGSSGMLGVGSPTTRRRMSLASSAVSPSWPVTSPMITASIVG